jgi:glycosyltransferase involved in cell wall biosynthesis
MKPLVSTIIPVFNGEKYLTEAINSVINQSYTPIEVIVVDDGSIDSSPRIAEGYLNIRLLRHEKNEGVSSTRNSGIKATKGSMIAFLDADDIWLPDKIQEQINFLEEQPDLGVCFVMEEFLYASPDQSQGWSKKKIFREPHPVYWPSSALIRKNCFNKVGFFDPSITHGEMANWLLRAKDIGISYDVLQETLFIRRVHESNASANISALKQGLLSSIRRVYPNVTL